MRQDNKLRKKFQSGVTLIALVITIIVILILAGVSFSILTGENGILTNAKEAKAKNDESEAREKLEIELADLIINKNVDSKYAEDENEYINNKLTNQGMIVIGDIVLVDGWKFQIDRSVPEIVAELGKGIENTNIQLEVTSTTNAGYVDAKLNIKITYDGDISEILIKGNKEEIPIVENGVYNIDKIIEKNGIYTIIVKDKDGNYKIETLKVTEITEDMDIWNKSDMELFRDMVKEGRTFENRTVRVMDDIDLEGNEENQWIPINGFSGTFNGNYHNIKNLYINSAEFEKMGLFSSINKSSIIENVIIENISLYSNNTSMYVQVGAIAGSNNGTIRNCGVNRGNIQAVLTSGSTEKYNSALVGGIVGYSTSSIENSYNRANVYGYNKRGVYSMVGCGGIVGGGATNLSQCYNGGNISGSAYRWCDIGGLQGSTDPTSKISNSYNYGILTGSSDTSSSYVRLAGILGISETSMSVENCYCTNKVKYLYKYNGGYGTGVELNCIDENVLKGYSQKLGEVYTDDEQNLDETWKYNNGFPILRWELKNIVI